MRAKGSGLIVPCVGIICFREEDVLLIKRGQPPKQGEWSIPGGRIEFGERVEDAALRELKEETGVAVELCGLVDVLDGIFADTDGEIINRQYLLCDYAARWKSGEPIGRDDAEHAEFVPLTHIGKLSLWSETVRVIKAARELVSKKGA